MQKGVSIFYESGDMGLPYIIAGIYTPYMSTEEEMRTSLLALLGRAEFNEHDQPVFINHDHLYAHYLLGNEIDDYTRSTLSRFFPVALEPQNLPVVPFKFEHYDGGAYQFILDNLYREQMREHRDSLIKESVSKQERTHRTGDE